jgi:hypothetical protein
MTEPTGPRLHYLHETVRIARNAASLDYMASVVEYGSAPPAATDSTDRPDMPVGVRLLGTFYTAAATGRWPEVVNVWECPGGLTGAWRSMLGIYHGLRREIFWSRAEDVRLGGDGIAFGAAPGCPTLDELVAAGVTGRLVIQHLATVRPGAARDYVEAIRAEWLPVVADHGHRLIGLYAGTYRHDQVCLLLATNEDARVSLQAAGDAACGYPEAASPDPRIPAWWARARSFLVGDWHEQLLVPYPGTPLAAPG